MTGPRREVPGEVGNFSKRDPRPRPRGNPWLLLFLGVITLYGCEGLLATDTQSLLAPTFARSEILGLIAGFGTTFAALPDLISMVRRRSSTGMNPKMAG
jgi:MtN3 and saliva related transmembrane protein